MTIRRKLPVLVANAALISVVLISCRSKPVPATATAVGDQPTTATVVFDEASDEDEEPPERVTIEVTRVVVATEVVVVTPEPIEVEPEPKELVVCITEEPRSLYPYGYRDAATGATHVNHGIYESLITNRAFDFQARGIEKIPSLADGDAFFKNVAVTEGDTVVDVDGDVVLLREGTRIYNIAGEEIVFEGSPSVMTQMVVSFTLRPMIWSDGTAVSADDSVYSFEIASDPHTPVPKNQIARTESYKATGDLTIEWTGIPGYLDRTYFTNIWSPYPRHYWGDIAPEDLLEAEISTRRPLSNGPFILSEWTEGEQIVLEKNENYYLAGEGLPAVDSVRFVFVPGGSQLIASLLSGQCDIATQEGITTSDFPSLMDAYNNGLIVPYSQIGTVFEHIDFGINPVEEYATERRDWFEDVRVRQAIVMCTDRQSMIDDLLFGQSELVHAYVPSMHPLMSEDVTEWRYDPAAANELLDEAGFTDPDEDGIRNDPGTNSVFRVKLLSSIGNDVAEKVAYRVRDDLVQCGIEVVPEFLSNEEYFNDGPEGPLFGRQFDMAAFPWLISTEPNCALYLSSRIPSQQNAWNRGYNNETGFMNDDFDAACTRALSALPGMPDYEEGHREALRIWSEQVPTIPLFMRLRFAASRPEVLNLKLDPTEPSELWNLYELDLDR